MRKIACMQGRLVPRYQNKYQAFPRGYWEAEFHIAREVGFDNIEFILDYDGASENPLMSDSGVSRIRAIIAETSIGVPSVCADYFMAAPFHSTQQTDSEKICALLLRNCARLGVRDLVIPCVDQSSLKTERDLSLFVDSMRRMAAIAAQNNVLLNLETDLPPHQFRNLLNKIDSPFVKVNYDIGNSASLGYDPKQEFEHYGAFISDVHVKDRAFGGSSVPLGSGSAQFDTVFECLAQIQFNGNFTLQASRAESYLMEIPRVKSQLDFTRRLVEKHLG